MTFSQDFFFFSEEKMMFLQMFFWVIIFLNKQRKKIAEDFFFHSKAGHWASWSHLRTNDAETAGLGGRSSAAVGRPLGRPWISPGPRSHCRCPRVHVRLASPSRGETQGTKDASPSQFSETLDWLEETAGLHTWRARALFPPKGSRGHGGCVATILCT